VYEAIFCNTLQHAATNCNTLQHTATHCSTLQLTAPHCNTHCNTHFNTQNVYQQPRRVCVCMQRYSATRCNTLQHTATHCSSLQHTATPYKTPATHTATHRMSTSSRSGCVRVCSRLSAREKLKGNHAKVALHIMFFFFPLNKSAHW